MTEPTPPPFGSTRPGTKTLVYAPEVKILVASGESRQIDVSRDVVKGQIIRRVNAASSLSFQLTNKRGKYTGLLRRMDRVSVWLKRKNWVQVFSGYLDSVPLIDLFPSVCEITATCTLKRLMHTYWDPALPESQRLLFRYITSHEGEDAGTLAWDVDAGAGALLIQVLKRAANWPEDNIHVQQIPDGFVDFARNAIETAIGGDDTTFKRDILHRQLITFITQYGYINGSLSQYGTAQGAPPPDSNGRYTMGQIAQVAQYAGFTGESLVTSVAVAWAESGGDIDALNTSNSDGSRDRGLWQINNKAHPQYSDYAMQNPIENARAAYNISNKGVNWRPWVAYTSNRHLQYMDQARQAVLSTPSLTSTPGSVNPNELWGWERAASGSAATYEELNNLYNQAISQQSGGNFIKPSANPVITWARSHLGERYVYGAPSPPPDGHTWDCSSYIQNAFKTVGITLPRVAVDQLVKGPAVLLNASGTISPANLQPGDVLFSTGGIPHTRPGVPPTGHVMLYAGNGEVLHAKGTNYGVVSEFFTAAQWSQVHSVTRPLSLTSWTSTTVAASNGDSGGENGFDDILFNPVFPPGSALNDAKAVNLRGSWALANDEQVLSTVQQLTRGSMRSFMSAPNGDFIAFFPDYFGLHGTTTKWDLEDIEMIYVGMIASDDALTTHVYTIGDVIRNYQIDYSDWMASGGIVTIDQKLIFDYVVNATGSNVQPVDSSSFTQRYGQRPLVQENPLIKSPIMEFFTALHLFMQKWSEQFSTNVEISFMPELFPGMRVNLKNHNLAVYVEEVRHTFDFEQGFTTDLTISSPSTVVGGLGGLPVNGMA